MARPKKAVNYETELSRLEVQITHHENIAKDLKEKYKELIQQKEQAEISRLYDFYKASGMSLDEMISVVSRGT